MKRPDRHPTPPDRGRREHRDRGQASFEIVGLVVVLALVVGVVGAVFVTRSDTIGAAAKAAVCRILGGTCTTESELHQPEEACVVTSHSVEGEADVVIFSVDIGGDASLVLTKEVGPDGEPEWYVTQQGHVHLGISADIGEDAGAGDVGEGISGEAKALLVGGGGEKLKFKSEADARNFMIAAEHEPIKQALTGWDPTGFTHWLADKIDGHHYDPPPPTEYFFEGGVKGSASVDGDAGVASGSLDASGTALVGYKVNTEDDTHTYYVKVSAEGAAKLGLLDVASANAGVEGEVVVGITYDKNGKPLKANLEAAGALSAGAGTMFDSSAGSDPAPGTPKAPKGTADVTANSGQAGTIGLEVDLTKGDNLNVVADGLHSLGVPVLLDSGTGYVDPVTGVRNIYDLFSSGADGTSATYTTYDTSSQDYSATFKGGEGVEFGVDGSLKIKDKNLTSGQYYVPGEGWVPWLACYQ